MKTFQSICWTALPLLLASPAAAASAQPAPEEEQPPLMVPASEAPVDQPAPPPGETAPAQTDSVLPGDPNAPIAFSADRVEYDENREVITASGDIFMFREGYRLLADRLIWTR